MADKDFARGIVKYTSRDYESIMKDFWDIVPAMTELWKPEASADPGVVLGKFLASVADMLGVNLDWLANEMFAPSVRQRKNAEKLFGLIGYELGWYTAARTEVTFTNLTSDEDGTSQDIVLDFGFNGSNFSTLNAYTDITGQSRVITYNILPMTNRFGATDTRSRRSIVADFNDVFESVDTVILRPGDSVTRVAIEGELRSYSISVEAVKKNDYIIKIPSQHIDTTAIWIRASNSKNADKFRDTQWRQVSSAADFITPEPRFAVTYDNYSNAQIQISKYLDELENYDQCWLNIYWIDCSGIIGCVSDDALKNYLQAKPDDDITGLETANILGISNLSNTLELPNTNTITGRSPETAKEAYLNSRNYINTFDSLVTLPDFNRFLNREPGVDCGLVLDCQKALELNLAIYQNPNLTDEQKKKKYITHNEFPEGDVHFDWAAILDMSQDPTDIKNKLFDASFRNYTAMCYLVHNDFKPSNWGRAMTESGSLRTITSNPTFDTKKGFSYYQPPVMLQDAIVRDYRPLQTMTVELGFGKLRIFNFHIVGQIYPKKPVSSDVGDNIIARVKEALAIYFAPANRKIGVLPTLMEVVDVVMQADDNIEYFDAGSLAHSLICWDDCNIDYFNPVSFARYVDLGDTATNIIIAPEYIVRR